MKININNFLNENDLRDMIKLVILKDENLERGLQILKKTLNFEFEGIKPWLDEDSMLIDRARYFQ